MHLLNLLKSCVPSCFWVESVCDNISTIIHAVLEWICYILNVFNTNIWGMNECTFFILLYTKTSGFMWRCRRFSNMFNKRFRQNTKSKTIVVLNLLLLKLYIKVCDRIFILYIRNRYVSIYFNNNVPNECIDYAFS